MGGRRRPRTRSKEARAAAAARREQAKLADIAEARTARDLLRKPRWCAPHCRALGWVLLVVGVPSYVVWLWKGATATGEALDPFAQGEPARAFVIIAVVTALPLWVGVAGTIVAHLRGAGHRPLPLWFNMSLLGTVAPAMLLLPGGRSGVSEHWVQQVDARTGGLGDEAAAGFIVAVLSGILGILVGYLLLSLRGRPPRRRGRLTPREEARERDIMLVAIVATVVGALALGVRFETW